MVQAEAIYDVLIFLVVAVVVVPVFERLRSSPVLGYLAAGIVIGPHGFAIVRDTQSVRTLAEFGVVFLLFLIGLELSVRRLRVMQRLVFGLGALQVAVTGLLIGAVAWAVGAGPEAAIVIGAGLALSSTAFVLQLLVERGEQQTRSGRVAFAILLFQDLAIVPLLILVPLLGPQELSLAEVLGIAALKAAAALALILAVGRLALRPLFRLIAGSRRSELLVATTLLVVVGTSWLTALAGLSMVLGAFLAGLLLAETAYRHQIEADIRPFRGILLGLFFVTVGMSIDISMVRNHAGTIALVVGGLLVGKTVVIAALCRTFGLPMGVAARAGFLLSQGGEFGFILFGVAMLSGVMTTTTGQVLMMAITLSMATTPFMAYAGKKLSSRLTSLRDEGVASLGAEAEGLADHVIIAGFGRVGQTVARMLGAAEVPYLALDLDPGRIARCRAEGMPLFYGDATQARVLSAAGAARARAAVITIDQATAVEKAVAAAHESFPELRIFARARDKQHGRVLADAGATAVVPETVEASLHLGGAVLSSIGTDPDDISRVMQDFRHQDYAKLEEVVGSS